MRILTKHPIPLVIAAALQLLVTDAGADTAAPEEPAAESPAGPAVADGEEVDIDLDALEEEPSPEKTGKTLIPDEPMLPVTLTEVEIHKNPWLATVALGLLVPVLLMLIPPRRSNRRRTSSTGPENKKRTKEA